ncbi:MAG TPA: methyltransferase domain-containing protein [Vicinamibacteria bacterium]
MKKLVSFVLLALVLAPLAAAKDRRPAPVMGYQGASWLERPGRDLEQRPDEVIRAMGLRDGDVVADLGAGTGYFTRRLAKAVAPSGRVYAVDVQPEMIAYLKREVDKAGLANVVPVLGTGDDPKLPPGAADWILLVDVYHELQQPKAMLARMLEALKPTGKVALVEYRLEGLTALHIREEHRMSPKQVLAEWEPAGFRLVTRHEFLPTQHFFVFERAVTPPAQAAPPGDGR